MTMQDPVADMLTRIRNAQAVQNPSVSMPSSKLKLAIAKVLRDEGYIAGFSVVPGAKPALAIELEVPQRSSGHRSTGSHQPAGLAYLSRQERLADGSRRPRYRGDQHVQRRDDRSRGAQGRDRR